jgi:transcriptional regulator with XRE-family HTH domain
MDSQWLKSQFELHPTKSKADLARHLKLEPPAISKILSGDRQIKAKEYEAMRIFFGLPVQNDSDGLFQKHMLNTLEPKGALSDNSFDTQWYIPPEVLQNRTNASSENIRIFKVEERLMEPDFRQGEHVLVDLTDRKPSPAGTFIVSDGFGFMIRQCEFIPKSKPPKITITAKDQNFHPQSLEFEGFQIIGRVIAKLEWL